MNPSFRFYEGKPYGSQVTGWIPSKTETTEARPNPTKLKELPEKSNKNRKSCFGSICCHRSPLCLLFSLLSLFLVVVGVAAMLVALTTTKTTITTAITTTTTSVTSTTSTSATTTSTTTTTTSKTSTTSTTSTTTTARPIVTITRAGDPIVGIYSTTAGGSSGGVNGTFSTPSEYPYCAIDGSTSTKYLNMGALSGCSTSGTSGLNTGFYVIPTASTSSVAFGLLFATGDDSPERDPVTVTLEGTNATTTAALNTGSSWTLIYNGPTGISGTVDPGRSTYVSQQTFTNALAFSSYRLLVTSQRNNANCVQYSEAEIIGYL